MSESPFNEENIQKLFGHEAAEDEDPGRLREYYLKTTAYRQMASEVSLRVLVGHKGIGKSALIQIAIQEAIDSGRIAILIQPNDITGFNIDSDDFLETIRNWTEGLSEVIAVKILNQLGVHRRYSPEQRTRLIGDPLNLVLNVLDNLGDSDYDPARTEDILLFCESPRVAIYFDDLDRGWQGRRSDVLRISALLNSVRDLSNRDRRLVFRVSLRSDVYHLVRTSDESTDKIEGSVIWHTWTNHEIFILLLKRIETYFGREINEPVLLHLRQKDLARYLDSIMDARFTGQGHWSNAPTYRVLMSLIRKRPRDLVKLCTLAARRAYIRGARQIGTEDLKGVFEEYSRGRIQDTVNEFRSELPNIQTLILNMKPNRKERQAKQGYVYNTAQLLEKIGNILESHPLRFADGRLASRQEVAAFLYKINFLTARKAIDAGIVRRYFEENQYLSTAFVDFGFDWEVHPAYRWALQPDTIDEIYNQLQLTIELEENEL